MWLHNRHDARRGATLPTAATAATAARPGTGHAAVFGQQHHWHRQALDDRQRDRAGGRRRRRSRSQRRRRRGQRAAAHHDQPCTLAGQEGDQAVEEPVVALDEHVHAGVQARLAKRRCVTHQQPLARINLHGEDAQQTMGTRKPPVMHGLSAAACHKRACLQQLTKEACRCSPSVTPSSPLPLL
eukprot:365578-Chlamydomonas_euryale.AAC.25